MINDPAYKRAIRASRIPANYFELIEKISNEEWLVFSHDPYGGRGACEMLLRANGDIVPTEKGKVDASLFKEPT